MRQIQKRGKPGSLKYTATVRLNGHSLSSTFPLKSQASDWCDRVEVAIREEIARGTPFNRDDFLPKKTPKPVTLKKYKEEEKEFDNTPKSWWTLERAIRKYEREELDKLKGYVQAHRRLQMWKKEPLAQKRLIEIKPEDLQKWIKSRRKVVKGKTIPVSPSTVRNDIYRISAIFELARTPKTKGGWNLLELENPVNAIKLPEPRQGRQRRLELDEDTRMFEALLEGLDGEQMVNFVTLSIETGMRRSEILGITKKEIRRTEKGLSVTKYETKNRHPRVIFLSKKAEQAVENQKQFMRSQEPTAHLFTLTADNIAHRWDIARAKIGSPDLRLHDLRHEAVSRLADKGLSVGALSNQSGHRSMQTLLRYVNAREADIREKLEK